MRAVVTAVALVVARLGGVRRALRRPEHVAQATIVDPAQPTTMGTDGAVRSVQAAELTLPSRALEEIWSPMHLERLARTYWRFLTRCTLGLVRVRYDEDERAVVLVARPFVMLRFRAPEYEMDAQRGIVRWRIADGLLVSRAGHGGDGYLQIEVARSNRVDRETDCLHVEVEVANFYPALASGIARWFYSATQSRIHVVITHSFLRSLARLDLAKSVVGRYAEDPPAQQVRDAQPASEGPARERTPDPDPAADAAGRR